MSQTCLNQQSAPSFPLDLLKSNSAPTLVTDSNGNHFLIALSSHVTENQRSDAPDGKATNQIPLQVRDSLPAACLWMCVCVCGGDSLKKICVLLSYSAFNKTNHSVNLFFHQRQQSTPAKLPGHNLVQLPRADNQTKQSAHVGFLKQQNTKVSHDLNLQPHKLRRTTGNHLKKKERGEK